MVHRLLNKQFTILVTLHLCRSVPKVGAAKFWEYYQAFGYSELTGIDLPGESDDQFFRPDGSMGVVDLAVASFGQGFSITPIQMLLPYQQLQTVVT